MTPVPHQTVLVVVVARIGDTCLSPRRSRIGSNLPGASPYWRTRSDFEVLRNLSFIDDLGSITRSTAWLKALISPR